MEFYVGSVRVQKSSREDIEQPLEESSNATNAKYAKNALSLMMAFSRCEIRQRR